MVNIDIITGFLGAGKTTFANILLNEYISRNEKVVYVVNEFGRTALDADIIKKEGFEAIALTNGCVCCSLKNQLVISMREIINVFHPDRIVFETSGIFIFNQFTDLMKDEYLREHCSINRTVTIIDSINYKKSNLMAGSFLSNQIMNSSILVISKLEKFTGDVSRIISDLKEVNRDAAILAQPWNEENFIENFLTASARKIAAPVYGTGHDLLDSLTVVTHRDMSKESFEGLKRDILSGRYGRIFRVKGTIRIDGEAYLLNIALDDVVVKKAHERAKPILTFIGDEIEEDRLREIFNN